MLMRAFSKVAADGKLSIPNNIRSEVGLKAGQLVELKVVGASKKRQLLLSPRESAR
jgi:bifunctional DNA-binding transcriptional regulator/antitoxin component of YhaV-PrlF toxin-antitoxin module